MTTEPKIYEQGYDAFPDLNMIDNPYEKWSPEYMQWNEGWRQKWFESLREEVRERHLKVNEHNQLAPQGADLSAAPHSSGAARLPAPPVPAPPAAQTEKEGAQ